jgi:hypothetical protein
MAHPFDLFHTHMRAFKLGTTTGAVTNWHERAQAHQDEKIREAWHAGFERGRKARAQAVREATELYGHTPSVLRVNEGEEES